MIHTLPRLLAAAALVVAAALAPPVAQAQGGAGDLHLLDVPYLPQSEALCGGAAVAMVMRYWGATGVYAESFAGLVDRDAGGIRGADLLRDLHARGWEATSFRGDPPLVQRQLSARRPVIALVEDRPGRFHYVVLVGWSQGRVILHDPARAPFRVVDEARFMRDWEQSGFWTMLASRGTGSATPTAKASPERGSAAAGPCQGLVDEGVRLAGTGEREDARRTLETAASSCPASAVPWRELAGLHALASEWKDAADDARRALARDRNDEQAARILATALYVEGDARGALGAWNALGEPRIDLVNVKGLDRTRYAVAVAAIGLNPGEVLTLGALDRAARRLDALPSAEVARVNYTPGQAGSATLDAIVVERPLFPSSRGSLAAVGARAITDRELIVTVASPTGGGEAWRASWRWWERRPRLAIGFDAPAPFGGTWGVAAHHDVQTYAGAAGTFEEVGRGAVFQVSDWTRGGLRWQLKAAVQEWRGRGRAASAGASIERRLLDDRAVLRADAGLSALADGAWNAALRAEWMSSTRREGQVWLARGGIASTGPDAPFAAWPGAGTGQGRDSLLRAHPLLHDGVVRGVFGRGLADAGVEWRQWRSLRSGIVKIAPALFADAARASAGLPLSNTQAQLDVGGGVRIALPGSGVVRLDLARGLRDGGLVFSAGWTK